MRKIFLFLSLAAIAACSDGGSTVASSSGGAKGKLYLRTYMWSGMYGTSLDISWIWLGNDGNIVRNPKHGVNPVDMEKERAENSGNTGTYVWKGDKLAITWANGKTAEWGTEKEKGELSAIDGGIVSQPDAMPANHRISGQYAASTVLPNVSSVQTLVFNMNGNFSQNSYGAVSTPDVSGESESDDGGTYDITGNTLTLRFNNGETRKAVIAIWDMDGEQNLVINSKYFPQEK